MKCQPFVSRQLNEQEPSGYVDLGFAYQQNGDVIADGVNPAALGAFQAFAVSRNSQRLLTRRANQNIQQVLGNHVRIVLHSLWQYAVAPV